MNDCEEGGQGSGAEEEEEVAEEEGGGVRARSPELPQTMQLFTLIASLSASYSSRTVERPSQQATTSTTTTMSVPRPHIVRTHRCVRAQTRAALGRRRFLLSLCRAAYAFGMRIKG